MFIHPLFLYSISWVVALSLYSLHWSDILSFQYYEFIFFFIFISLIFSYFINKLIFLSRKNYQYSNLWINNCNLYPFFFLFLLSAIFEIIHFAGFPLLWKFNNDPRSYFDFGIQSFHGLSISLINAISCTSFLKYLIEKNKKTIILILAAYVWSLLCLSRNNLIVLLTEQLILLLYFRKIQISKFFVSALIITFLFGVIGDLRTSGFENISGVNDNFPTFLPLSLMWAYNYATVPLENILNIIKVEPVTYNEIFSETLFMFLPSIFRNQLEQHDYSNSVNIVFNTATAFQGPYVDYGYIGIFLYIFFTFNICFYFYRRKKDYLHLLSYAVLGQCAFFTIFFNHFFAPTIFMQIIWFYIFKKISSGNRIDNPSS